MVKLRSTILLLAILASSAFGQDNGGLYPIPKGDLWGYIDTTGATVIAPRFHAAGRFSEGLAPVRLNGTYGYIDRTGAFVIAPAFDVAYSFDHGLAQVFVDAKPYFIDKLGHIAFRHSYKRITAFGEHSYAIAETISGLYGLIDRSGNLIADTVFAMIGSFANARAVVHGAGHSPYGYVFDSKRAVRYEAGVIDTTGKWIVPYGLYKEIYEYSDGYAVAEVSTPRTTSRVWTIRRIVLDSQGRQRFTIPEHRFVFSPPYQRYDEGLAIVDLYYVELDTTKYQFQQRHAFYKGVVDTNGDVVFSDKHWGELTPFSCNRAFAYDRNGEWKMIDRTGRQIGDRVFDDVVYGALVNDVPTPPFVSGVAFVKHQGKWCAIDTSCNVVEAQRSFKKELDRGDIYRVGSKVFVRESDTTKLPLSLDRIGFYALNTNTYVEPEFDWIDMSMAADHDLLFAMKHGLHCYIKNDGAIVWMAEKQDSGSLHLSLDHMNVSHFVASSTESSTVSTEIDQHRDQLQVVIDLNQGTRWSGVFVGMKIHIANTSKDTVYFPTLYSRLRMTLQAKNKDGEWRDIEYEPLAVGGSGTPQLFLAPDKQWSLNAPVYHGEFKTKLRAQLTYKRTIDQKNDDVVYSNEIDGYVNPGQFWYKREYHPRGLMDPYND